MSTEYAPQAFDRLLALAPAPMSAPAGSAPFDLSNFQGGPASAFAGVECDSLAKGLGYGEMPPLDFAPLIKKGGCEFLREALITGGKDYDQPMWNLTTLSATFLVGGERLAHKMGNKHPTYTPEETKTMWERKMREREDHSLGWPSCSAIHSAGCAACAACPHFAKGKSPLNLSSPPVLTAPLPEAAALSTAASTGPVVWAPADLKVPFSRIGHRHWLYGTYLIRGELTVEGAPGGAGKTAHAAGMAVEIATGKEVLGERIWGGGDLKSLYINSEDSGVEMWRRIWAFCLAHNIAEQSLDRLYVAGIDDPRLQHLSFLRTVAKNTALDPEGFKQLDNLFAVLCPDLVILDPLVAFCGGGDMNDNAVMALVVRELKRLAAKFNCAILIVHHNRKGGEPGSAEAISGAAAIVNLARRAIMPVPMTDKEMGTFGVLPSERSRYIKMMDAKSNFAPRSADSPWYQMHSVELPNHEPPIFPHGDNVQAITRVNLQLLNNWAATADDLIIRRAIVDLVDRGKMIDGQSYPYSPSLAGAQNARSLLDEAVAVVRNATVPRQWGLADLEAVTKRTIDKMKDEGWLVDELIGTGRFRKGRGLTVDRALTPWPHAGDNGSTPLDDPAAPGEEDLPDAPTEGGGQLVNSRSID